VAAGSYVLAPWQYHAARALSIDWQIRSEHINCPPSKMDKVSKDGRSFFGEGNMSLNRPILMTSAAQINGRRSRVTKCCYGRARSLKCNMQQLSLKKGVDTIWCT
jgi:hypothetical protein